jgi:hypothetical protein
MSPDATFVIVGTESRATRRWTTLARMARSRRRSSDSTSVARISSRAARIVPDAVEVRALRFEPDYSLRYERPWCAVGGLVDTVKPYNPKNGQGTGFLFASYHPAMMQASRGARYPNKKIWTRLQKNGMRADFSWDRSAGEYVKMYQRLRPRKPPGPQKAQKAQKARKRNSRAASASKI